MPNVSLINNISICLSRQQSVRATPLAKNTKKTRLVRSIDSFILKQTKQTKQTNNKQTTMAIEPTAGELREAELTGETVEAIIQRNLEIEAAAAAGRGGRGKSF